MYSNFEVASMFFVLWFSFCLVPSILNFILKKKCGYDCSKCKVLECDYHTCKRKREKLESKAKEQ